jgi:hypothetical protein
VIFWHICSSVADILVVLYLNEFACLESEIIVLGLHIKNCFV